MKYFLSLVFIVIGLILNVGFVSAKTRNLIIEETPDHQFGTANSVLLGDFIIYQTRDEDLNNLWSYNTLTNENTKIFTGDLSRFSFFQKYIYVIKDSAYFVSGTDSNYLFWKTDGTLSGTSALDSPTFFPHHSKIDDFLFTWSATGTLLSTDGNEVIEHMLEYPAITTICPFANNDVIAIINEINTQDTTIVRSTDGVISNLSSDFATDFQVREGNSFNLNGNCHVLAFAFEGGVNTSEWFVIPEQGPIKTMSDQIEVADISSLFAYQDRIYVMAQSSSSNNHSLFRLRSDMTGYDAEFSVDSGFAFTTNRSLTEDYIIVKTTTPTASPPVDTVYYLDKNLQVNEILGGRFQPIPTAYATADGELFAFRSVGTYSDTINRDDSNPLVITDSFVSDVMTYPDSADAYLKITDRGSQESSIVKIANTPDINESTAGIWHDPLIQNQGLLINRGQRADGSSYLFVSVYTQDQGQPLWLAGNANINFPQSTIDIDLSHYSGTEFFQPGTEAIQTNWGSVNLEMTSCDGLRATFTQPSESARIVDLIRIDNTQFDYLCAD